MTAPASPPTVRAPRIALILLFLGSFGLFGLFAHGYVENTDAEITLHAARAWWERGGPGLLGPGAPAPVDDPATTWPAEAAILGYIADPKLPRYGRLGRDGKGYVWFPIGHQALLVPAVALGDGLDALFPDVEPRFRQAKNDPVFGQFFWPRFVASFVSPLFAAATVVALVMLLLALGASPGAALLGTAVATLCTQFWPGALESLSDTPGTFFLIATATGIARYRVSHDAAALLWAGVLGGLGVLVRYPQALPLCGLGAWAVFVALRARRPLDAVWFVIGGMPPAALLVFANLWRFGAAGETGYGSAVGFGSYPLLWGLPAILVAAGKGILWFSLPLWLAFAQFGKRTVRGHAAVWFALLTLVAPLPLYATLHYWAAGACWGIRYLTGVIVLFVAIALALGRPWQTAPRWFWSIATLGALASIGGVVAPYVGHQQFAFAAGREYWKPATEVSDNINWDPSFSPLHGHWTYAYLALDDRIASGHSKDTTEPLFGVAMPDAAVPRPARENAGFRHLWWRYVADYWPGFAALPVIATIGGLALVFLVAAGWLVVRRSRPAPVPRDED